MTPTFLVRSTRFGSSRRRIIVVAFHRAKYNGIGRELADQRPRGVSRQRGGPQPRPLHAQALRGVVAHLLAVAGVPPSAVPALVCRGDSDAPPPRPGPPRREPRRPSRTGQQWRGPTV